MPGEPSNSGVSPCCSDVAKDAEGGASEEERARTVLDALTAARDGWLVRRDPAALLATLSDVLRQLSRTV